MKKEVCIFDFDGTLVDSMEGLTECAATILHRFYQMPPDEARQRYLETSGLPFAKQLEVIFPEHPDNPKAARAFEDEKKTTYFDHHFYQDAAETLHYLKSKGLKVVISSGNRQEILTEFLAKKKMDVDLVLGYRPDFLKGARHFAHISEKLKTSPSEMIFVGDSLHDARSAYGSEIDFIGKEGIFTKDEFQKAHPKARSIRHLTELKELL